MPQTDALQDRLSRYREIKITVTGRKSGRAISIPVWFVLENDNLYLVPVMVRTHSGIRTCSRTRPCVLTRGARKRNFRLPLLRTQNKCRP